MTFRKDLKAFLDAAPLLFPLVGTRIHPQSGSTEDDSDYITFDTIGNPSTHNFAGASEIADETIQFNCWSRSSTTAYDIAEALRLSLDGLRGIMGDTYVKGIFVQNMIDTTEPPADATQFYWYRRAVMIKFVYRRNVPTGTLEIAP